MNQKIIHPKLLVDVVPPSLFVTKPIMVITRPANRSFDPNSEGTLSLPFIGRCTPVSVPCSLLEEARHPSDTEVVCRLCLHPQVFSRQGRLG